MQTLGKVGTASISGVVSDGVAGLMPEVSDKNVAAAIRLAQAAGYTLLAMTMKNEYAQWGFIGAATMQAIRTIQGFAKANGVTDGLDTSNPVEKFAARALGKCPCEDTTSTATEEAIKGIRSAMQQQQIAAAGNPVFAAMRRRAA
ncbi:hypothetical protein [Pustulibacterium marinum]|nr:hypothetical protein [Pustulibacterium marinum]